MKNILIQLILIPMVLLAGPEDKMAVFSSYTNLLPRLSAVEGHAVYFGGEQGTFHKFSEVIRQHGTERDFLAMAENTNAAVRCMGIYCIANSESEQSLEIVKRNLTNQQLIDYYPYGCCGSKTSIGSICWEILKDRNHLDDIQIEKPMGSVAELAGIALEVLSSDETWHVHWEASRYLYDPIDEGKVELSLPFLREIAPQLEDYQIIKAVGRVQTLKSIKPFLIELLQAEGLDDLSKMTVASSLTRFGDEEIYGLVSDQSEYLDSLSTNFGSIIQADIKTATEHKKNMIPIDKERTWRGMELMMDHLLFTYSRSHPVAFSDLSSCIYQSTPRKHQVVRRTIIDSLISMSRKKWSYDQPWNTYSDVPYRMRGFLIKIKIQDRYKDYISQDEFDLIWKLTE